VLLLRLVVLVLLSVLFTATTVPVDVARGFARLLAPLGRLRLPVHELGMLLVLALSFVPVFFAEARTLAAAHRLKVGRARWGLAPRLRAALPLVVPLFVAVLRRADELAVAMDARCFVPGRPRSAYVPARFGGAEIGFLALGLAILLACFWL
jgi:energy-coupling factor transport system permease protein